MRADAGVAMGTGHAMRCFALAQAWQDAGGSAVFVMAQVTPAIEQRLQGESMEVVRLKAEPGSGDDAQETIALAARKRARWGVVDGYHFGADYQATLKRAGLKVLFVDDNGHAGHYSADLALNQNAHADEAFYQSRDASTRLLLGPRFAMLRREFSEWRAWSREISAVARRVLVTMGGSDPDNVTEKVVRAILGVPGLNATAVVGGSNPHLLRLRELVASAQRDVQLVDNVSNMPELMANADLAISGAGTTGLEMCFLGLPALLIVLAENQRPAAEELGRRGAAINLGEGAEISAGALAEQLALLLASREKRKTMSEAGRKLVDGLGAERVVAQLNDNGETE
jgi:UDP-2,4-diacetamido-2,4,6-trideoxy-beta-L-altropyranose hydrolase